MNCSLCSLRHRWLTHSLNTDSTLSADWKVLFFFQTCPLLQEASCQKSPLIDHQEGEVGGIPSASRWGCWPTSRWACWQLLLCRQAMGWAASTPQNSEEPHIHYSGHLSSSLQLPTSNVKTNTPPNITRKQVFDFVYEYDSESKMQIPPYNPKKYRIWRKNIFCFAEQGKNTIVHRLTYKVTH